MARKIGKIVLIVFVALFLIALTLPFAFKGKIKEAVKKEASSTLYATVNFGKISLSMFRSFPDFTLGINDVSVVGVNEFKGDTLAGISSLKVTLNLWSVIGGSDYEIKKIQIDKARLQFKVLADGKANWDIVKPTEPTPEEPTVEPSKFKITLKKLAILDSYIVYDDASSNTNVKAKNIDLSLSGDFTADFTSLKNRTDIESLYLSMGGVPYLNKTKIALDATLDADLKNSKFTFKKMELSLNDLVLGTTGWFAMPEDAYDMDIKFYAQQNDFKSFLSLIPAIYTKDFSSVETKGTLAFDGFIKGTYNDNTIPSFGIKLKVGNAMFKYPSLPAAVININIDAKAENPNGNPDATAIDITKFHMEMAGNPVDMMLAVRTPLSDPQLKGNIKGAFDLAAVSKVYPLDKGMTMTGTVKGDVSLDGCLSSIEKEKYEEFKASGNITASNVKYKSADLPKEISIPSAVLNFTPAYLDLTDFRLKSGNSELSAQGKLMNYLAYFLKKNAVLEGSLTTVSKNMNLADFMTTSATTTTTADTTSMTVTEIPANIDFTLNSTFGKLVYDKYEMTNVNGIVKIKDQELKLDDLKMNMLDGQITMNGTYNTRNIKSPQADLSFDMSQVDIQKAFKTFLTVQKLAPIADKTTGKVSTKMTFAATLDEHMNPVYSSINGNGALFTSVLKLENVNTLNKIADALKMDKLRKLALDKINLSFDITDGKVNVKPFDIKTSNIKTNVSGWAALDQTIGYIMNMEIPRKEFGGQANGVLNNMLSQANAKGANFSVGEMIPVAVIIGGTITNPKISTGIKGTMTSAISNLKEQAKQEIQKKKEEVVTKVKNETNKLIDEADAKAAKILADAQKQADNIMKSAEKAAADVRSEATKRADQLVAEGKKNGPLAKIAAQKAADKVKKEADVKANKLVAEAGKQSQAVMDKARQQAEKIKQDAKAKVK